MQKNIKLNAAIISPKKTNENVSWDNLKYVKYEINANMYEKKHIAREFHVYGNNYYESFKSFSDAFKQAQIDQYVWKISYIDENNVNHRWVKTTKEEIISLIDLKKIESNIANLKKHKFVWMDKPIVVHKKHGVIVPYQKVVTENDFCNLFM